MDVEDQGFMRQALEAAELGHGRVSPNPPVGCVLVRDGEVIATGWHDRLGDLHAEQAAIADAEERGVATEGCTAYVTLEPCNHHGRTPPCTQALLWAGVAEVIIATRDPNPTVRGMGVEALEEAGVPVRVGCLEEEAMRQMQAFMRWCEQRRPIVTLKVAMDANGIIDAAEGLPSRFTSDDSLDLAHRLRRMSDAILVGVNTVVRDDPSLTVRRVPLDGASQPLRVVLDSNLRTVNSTAQSGRPESPDQPGGDGTSSSLEADSVPAVLNDAAPTLLVHSGEAEGDRLVSLPGGPSGIDLSALLDLLGDRGVQEVLVEGGGSVWRSFLDAGLADRAILIRAPIELGAGPSAGIDARSLTASGLRLDRTFESGDDSVEAWSRPGLGWPSDAWF